jgi:hypothetical protein
VGLWRSRDKPQNEKGQPSKLTARGPNRAPSVSVMQGTFLHRYHRQQADTGPSVSLSVVNR